MGIYAAVLAILGLSGGLAEVADRVNDALGLNLDENRLPKKIMPVHRVSKRIR